MPDNKSNKLLREYIEAVVKDTLREDSESDYGFDVSQYGGGGGGGETGHGGGNDLYNTFIRPFTDVGQTIAYGVEKLSAQAATVVKGILYGLPTLFVPFLDYDYEKFREDEAEKVHGIEEKYKEVLGRNWEAITSNDAFGLAFVFEPGLFLGAKLLAKSPEIVLSILDDLTNGYQAVKDAASQFHVALQGMQNGEHLHEGVDPRLVQAVGNLLKDKKVQQMIDNNPVVKQGRADAMELMVDRVRKIMAAKDYNTLQQLLPQAVGKITQVVQANEKQGKLPPQQDAAVKANLLPQLKQKYKEFYIGKLNAEAGKDPNMKPYIQNALKQIQALK